MSGLHITPLMMERSYLLLLAAPPFNKLKMPDVDEIEFHAVHMKGKDDADYRWNGSRHQIRVNIKRHKTYLHLLESMAHEMIHMYQEEACLNDRRSHGPMFRKLKMAVCRHHLFDPGQF